MRNAIIVHGKPPEARYNDPYELKPHETNWLPWLGRRLEYVGISTAIPALPKPYFPVYEDWRQTFEQCYVDEHTGLIGHSAGTELILRWATENPQQSLANITLVAPYRDEARKYGDFSEYELDTSLVERVGRIVIFNSLDDSKAIQENAHRLAEELPTAELIELEGYGHFMYGNKMETTAFPELLTSLLEN